MPAKRSEAAANRLLKIPTLEGVAGMAASHRFGAAFMPIPQDGQSDGAVKIPGNQHVMICFSASNFPDRNHMHASVNSQN